MNSLNFNMLGHLPFGDSLFFAASAESLHSVAVIPLGMAGKGSLSMTRKTVRGRNRWCYQSSL